MAAIVAVIGLALLATGVLRGTVFRPPSTTTATLGAAPAQPVVVSQAGMMGLAGPRLVVTAKSSSTAPVFLGIGRARDVEQYLGKVSRLSLTGENGAGALTTSTLGSEKSLPDPGLVDVWVVSVRGDGTATLTWPDVEGQWALVAATDGTQAAPAELTFTWSGAKPPASGSAFIAIGAVLLICGVVLLIMLASRAKAESASASSEAGS